MNAGYKDWQEPSPTPDVPGYYQVSVDPTEYERVAYWDGAFWKTSHISALRYKKTLNLRLYWRNDDRLPRVQNSN